MSRGSRKQGWRRWTRVGALAAAMLGCTGGDGTTVAPGATAGLAAQLAVDASTEGLEVLLSVASVPGGSVAGSRTIPLSTPGSDQVPLEVNLGACLAEAGGDACQLRLTGTLLSATGQTLDVATTATFQLAPGQTVTLPTPLQLFEVNNVQVTPSPLPLEVGGSQQLTVNPRNAQGVTVVRPASAFTVAPTGVVSVTAAGLVTCLATGTATISTTIGGRTGGTTVTCSARPQIVINPTSLSFNATAGQTTTVQAPVSVTNGGGGTLANLVATPSVAWLSATLGSTTAPTQAQVTANPTGLAAGVHTGTVALSVTGRPDITPVTVSVTLTVAQAPSIVLTPQRLTFTANAGGALPNQQTVTITNGGGGTLTGLGIASVIDSVTGLPADVSWLTVTLSSTQAPTTLHIRPNTTQPPGTRRVRFRIASTAPGVTNSPQIVDVRYDIGTNDVIVANPTTLTFAATQGGALPPSQFVGITSSGSTPITGLVATASQPWLAALLAGASTPTQLDVRPNSTSLAPGTYTGNITVRSAAIPTIPSAVVGVTYIVSSTGVPVTGRVANALTNAGIANATVTAFRLGNPVSSTTTDSQGAWSLNLPLATDYTISVTAAGYVGASVVSFDVAGPTTAPSIPLAPTSAQTGTINATPKSATTGLPIGPGVTVELRQHVNNRVGATVGSTTTGASGVAVFANVPAGTYSLLGKFTGFLDGIATAVSVGGQTTSQDVLMSPSLGGSAFRVVLRWGNSPPDLDSHLTYPSGATRSWIYFESPGDCNTDPVCLDVDDVDGNGPETITIKSVAPGVYRYYVNNYSNQFNGDPVTLAQSNAVVEVYQGTSPVPVRTFAAPQLQGTMWFVFELSGTTVTPINTMVSFDGSQPARIASPFTSGLPDDLTRMFEVLRTTGKRTTTTVRPTRGGLPRR